MKRFFRALVLTSALVAGPSTAAQAAWQPASESTLTSFCSGTYTNIPALRVRECILTSSTTGGAWVWSRVEVENHTSTARWIDGFTGVVVGGQVQPRTDCGQTKVPSYTTAFCDSARSFVVDGTYGYGRGWVKDLSSGLSSWAYSPIYRP